MTLVNFNFDRHKHLKSDMSRFVKISTFLGMDFSEICAQDTIFRQHSRLCDNSDLETWKSQKCQKFIITLGQKPVKKSVKKRKKGGAKMLKWTRSNNRKSILPYPVSDRYTPLGTDQKRTFATLLLLIYCLVCGPPKVPKNPLFWRFGPLKVLKIGV